MVNNISFIRWLIDNYKDANNKFGDLTKDYIDDAEENNLNISTYTGLKQRIKHLYGDDDLPSLKVLDDAYNIFKSSNKGSPSTSKPTSKGIKKALKNS